MPDPVAYDILSVLRRQAGSFAQNLAGVTSLFVLLIAGLNLPSVF